MEREESHAPGPVLRWSPRDNPSNKRTKGARCASVSLPHTRSRSPSVSVCLRRTNPPQYLSSIAQVRFYAHRQFHNSITSPNKKPLIPIFFLLFIKMCHGRIHENITTNNIIPQYVNSVTLALETWQSSPTYVNTVSIFIDNNE